MLGIVSHDAGGAEILASYVARNGIECRVCLDGPARAVFRRRLGDIVSSPLSELIANCDTILTGTSWQSDLEFIAIGEAKARGRSTAAFLDHWGNYRERFQRAGKMVLPDEIWVGDQPAWDMAVKLFSPDMLRLVPNPHFEDVRDAINALPRREARSALDILYVCEPLSEHGRVQFGDERYWGYTEFESLQFLADNLGAFGSRVGSVVVRPHPSEVPSKYDEQIASLGPQFRRGGGATLLEEIAAVDVVVGCESMAMVIGMLAGRRVVAAIPPGGRPSALPHPQIELLEKMASNGQDHSDA